MEKNYCIVKWSDKGFDIITIDERNELLSFLDDVDGNYMEGDYGDGETEIMLDREYFEDALAEAEEITEEEAETVKRLVGASFGQSFLEDLKDKMDLYDEYLEEEEEEWEDE